MKICLILVDDEPPARLGIRARLERHKDFAVVEEASSTNEALEKIERLRPDAVFLDIEMLTSSGLELAHMLEGPRMPLVVFLTAHRQYAQQAFDVEAIDYLVKPVHDDRFEIALDRLREAIMFRRATKTLPLPQQANRNALTKNDASFRRIAVGDRNRMRLIDRQEIDWIRSAGGHSTLYFRGKEHVIREPISALLRRLPPNEFLRIHRSTIINLSRVTGLVPLRNQDLLVTLKDGTVLRASRSFSRELKRALPQKQAQGHSSD